MYSRPSNNFWPRLILIPITEFIQTPSPSLQVVGMVDAYTMTSQVALHILATDNFTDQFGVKRCVCTCIVGVV